MTLAHVPRSVAGVASDVPSEPRPGAARRLVVLATCCLSLFLVTMDLTIVNVALPSIRRELHASVAGLQWAIDGYTVVVASCLMLSGSLADRYGRRRTFQLGLAVFSLGSLLCSLAPTTSALVGFRALQAEISPPGAKVAMLSKNCAHFIVAELAIWMAGYTTVAIFPTEGADTVRYVLNHSGARLLFVGKLDSWGDQKAGVAPDLPCIALPLSPKTDFETWEGITAMAAPMDGKPARKGDDLCLLMYTSGSTGTPKGVMHSFAGITAAAEGIVKHLNERLGAGADRRLVSPGVAGLTTKRNYQTESSPQRRLRR